MPVILPTPAIATWLTPTTSIDELPTVLASAPDDLLKVRPVSRRLNKAGAVDDPSVLELP